MYLVWKFSSKDQIIFLYQGLLRSLIQCGLSLEKAIKFVFARRKCRKNACVMVLQMRSEAAFIALWQDINVSKGR